MRRGDPQGRDGGVEAALAVRATVLQLVPVEVHEGELGRHEEPGAHGWGGRHTLDAPVVVVTHTEPDAWVREHPDAPFTFVTDGVAAAVDAAQELAGDRTVAVAAGTVAAQCLQLGLLDVVAIDLVPVVMGGGRPFFPGLAPEDVPLGAPETCVAAARVTHLRFPVLRG